MLDLIIRKARVQGTDDGNQSETPPTAEIGIADGKIVAITPKLEETAAQEIDAGGYLVSPPFVDPHFHMDATLSLGLPRLNQSGTLLEGIALWG
ncbi:MAG: amidohydrolase family protein, partial [Pseudomonadota bacterium]